jgi:hypothetical protein
VGKSVLDAPLLQFNLGVLMNLIPPIGHEAWLHLLEGIELERFWPNTVAHHCFLPRIGSLPDPCLSSIQRSLEQNGFAPANEILVDQLGVHWRWVSFTLEIVESAAE